MTKGTKKLGRRRDFSFRELSQISKNNGFELVRVNGDHYICKRNNERLVITKPTNCMVARRLIKEFNLEV